MLQSLFQSMSQRGQRAASQEPAGASRQSFWARKANSRRNHDDDRSRSPRRLPAAGSHIVTQISDVKDTFLLPKHIVGSMASHYGEDRVKQALMKLKTGSLTTSFTGCGVAEATIEALAKTQGVDVNLGHALDWDSSCQSVIRCRWPSRCCFGDIKDLVKGLKEGKGKRPPSCSSLAEKAHCYTHQRMCSCQSVTTGGLDVELAGPVCPPWSAFGKGKGTDDPRYESHEAFRVAESVFCFVSKFQGVGSFFLVPLHDGRMGPGKAWLAKVRRTAPHVLIFENVERYPEELIMRSLEDMYEISKATLNPPEIFSIPTARPRQYYLLYNKHKTKWVGPAEVGPPLCCSWLECVQPCMIQKPASLSPLIYTADPDSESTRKMTPSESKHLKQYQAMVKNKELRSNVTVFDLRQSSGRPVTSLSDGSLPTLRTTSNSLYFPKKRQFLSGMQLLRAQGWPIHESDSAELGLDHIKWPSHLSNAQNVEMAGNAMFGPCAALAVLTALMFVERKELS